MAKAKAKTKRAAPSNAKLAPEVAGILLAVAEMRGDQAAAGQFGVCLKTVSNYRRRMREGDGALADHYAAEKRRLVDGVRDDIVITIRAACARARELLPDEKDVHKVMGAVKIAGDLVTVRDALGNGEQPRHPRPGEAPPPPPKGANGAEGAAHHPDAIN